MVFQGNPVRLLSIFRKKPRNPRPLIKTTIKLNIPPKEEGRAGQTKKDFNTTSGPIIMAVMALYVICHKPMEASWRVMRGSPRFMRIRQ